MNLTRNISGLKFGGTHRIMPNGQLVLTTLGERLKGHGTNKLYNSAEGGILEKYKNFGIKTDLELKKLLTRWQRKFFISRDRCFKRERDLAIEKVLNPSAIVAAGGKLLAEVRSI